MNKTHNKLEIHPCFSLGLLPELTFSSCLLIFYTNRFAEKLLYHVILLMHVLPYACNITSLGCDGSMDVVFLLDASGSIRHERFPNVLDFATKIVAEMDVHPQRARVAAASWSDNAHLNFYLDQFSVRQKQFFEISFC